MAVCMTEPGCAWEGVSMNCDTFGGAVHGLGKRGTGVDIADHGRAGDEPEPLADVGTGMGEPRSGEAWPP